MTTLELSAEELAVVEDALEGFLDITDGEIQRLEDLEFDGIYVDQWEFEDRLREEQVAEQLLMQIDEIWYDAGFGFEDDWFDEESYWDENGWDDPVVSEEEVEYADA